jgi:hypothetical protein
MLPDTAACKSSTNYVNDFGGKNLKGLGGKIFMTSLSHEDEA